MSARVWILIYRDDYPFEAWSTEEAADRRAKEIGEVGLAQAAQAGRTRFKSGVSYEDRVDYFAPAVCELDLDTEGNPRA